MNYILHLNFRSIRIPALFIWTLVFCLFSLVTNAQPKPCTDPPQMTSYCSQACIICDIDGFTGRNGSGGQGEAPPGFCTTYLHNGKWIGFIAGSVDLRIRLSVSNCNKSNGLELAIYEGIDCDNYRLVSNCRGGANDNAVGNNSSGIFYNTSPLTVGQYYYIVMDGSNGSICDWTFEVLQGSTHAPKLTSSGDIDGPDVTCHNELDRFSTSGQVGATIFNWTVNGSPIVNTGQNISITWPQPGSYEVCVIASNVCDEAPPSCKTIDVLGKPETFIDATICANSVYVVDDSTQLSVPGEYEFTYPDENGCDSLVRLNLALTNVSIANISANICDGDTLFVGNTPFYQDGNFTETIQNSNGCDSLVNLDLNLIVCNMQGSSIAKEVNCFGEKNGRLTFRVENGTAPFSYSWKKLNSTINGTGNLAAINQDEIIENLEIGTYLITVSDQFGNNVIIIGTVNEPEIMSSTSLLSNYGGFNVNCFGGNDGSIKLTTSGGTGPYEYVWSNGSNSDEVVGLAAGDYEVTITDSKGCKIFNVINVNQPTQLSFDFSPTDPTCTGKNSGSIALDNITGGTRPYTYSLDNKLFGDQILFENLESGKYIITLKDANGCLDTISTELIGKIIPILTLSEDVTILLSEEIQLDADADIPITFITWTPSTGLSCDDCESPLARPFINTTYIATITSEDGCIDTDTLEVRVVERRRVFVPNVFSPNNDGINDIFYVNAGPEVMRILTFNVYNRWGASVYQSMDYLPDEDHGWDGTFRGKQSEAGVYAWFAEVEFLDGQTRTYKGDVTLVR